jgi:O-antigen ligase
LEDATWLFNSAKQRVVIWQSVAERIEERPLLGAGATAGDLPMRVDLTPVEAGPSKQPSVTSARHPHDIYLQVWYELGLTGVLLLLLFGWSVFRCIDGFARDAQPYALALFALTATMAATSYGLWQFWFQCLLGLGFVIASLARAR